jgi:catechol 2,3-dioxygenase-like lactoylglutathione lyase family enzyme
VFDHVTVRVSDRDASERFYDTVLEPLGIAKTHTGSWYAEWNDYGISAATEEKPVTGGLHVGFAVPSREHVERFWRVGTDAGYRSDGEPGLRPQYSEDYYGAFVLDPDGNSVEAVHHGDVQRRSGNIDHLWIRVADVDASRRFYEAVAPHAGFRSAGGDVAPERARFAADAGASFSVVAGEPTRNLHVAFPVADNATVDAFHRHLVAAGYEDHGGPGERRIYHAGYYGAYVLDPDGNNVELVNHNR